MNEMDEYSDQELMEEVIDYHKAIYTTHIYGVSDLVRYETLMNELTNRRISMDEVVTLEFVKR